MKKIYYQIIITIFIFSLTFGTALSFDNEYTHREITKSAIKNLQPQIDNILKNNLGLQNGVNEYFQKRTIIHGFVFIQNGTIIDLLRQGAFLEDEPECRASNHFHNPLNSLSWTNSGMSDDPWFLDLWCAGSQYSPGNIKSNVHWATGFTESAEREFLDVKKQEL